VRPLARAGLVALGYVGALLVALAVVAFRVVTTSGPEAQASSGMYAFGDALLFVSVFGGLALVPTVATLYFLRPYPMFWTALAIVAIMVALTGVAAAIVFAAGRHETSSTLAAWTALCVLRILGAPLFAVGWLACGLMAPARAPRLALLMGVLLEAVVSAYGAFIWVGAMFGRY
jgi:hypothetical protein